MKEAMKPSFLASTVRIFDLSLGEMLWARRTIFMAAIVTAPVLLAVVARVAPVDGEAILRINGARVGSAEIFGMMLSVLYLKFIIPVLGVFYGTSLIADEVEDKTITYLFTRPIPRRSIVMGKFIAYLLCAASMVLPSVTLMFLLMVRFADMAAAFGPVLEDLGVLAIGLAAYGAVFLLAGVTVKRPLVAGLVFAFGWEQIALVMPGYLKHFTIAYYLQALLPQATPGDTVSLLQVVTRDVPSAAVSLICLSVAVVTALILAMRTVERREYVLEQ
jgi:ABC-type transport system involved in multi-copper enzyme maturation permease subunit